MFFIQISQNTELYFCTQPSILWIVKNLYMYFISPDSSSFSRKSLCKKTQAFGDLLSNGKKTFCSSEQRPQRSGKFKSLEQ